MNGIDKNRILHHLLMDYLFEVNNIGVFEVLSSLTAENSVGFTNTMDRMAQNHPRMDICEYIDQQMAAANEMIKSQPEDELLEIDSRLQELIDGETTQQLINRLNPNEIFLFYLRTLCRELQQA